MLQHILKQLLKGRRGTQGTVLAIIIGLVTYFYPQFTQHQGHGKPVVVEQTQNTSKRDDSNRLVQAHKNHHSKVWLTLQLVVKKRLRDDLDGNKHQKFLAKPLNGPTLLVVHNIDLAPRVPLKEGDHVIVRGRYEWDARGGVLHWTHHDPRQPNRVGEKEGWIEHNGKRYE